MTAPFRLEPEERTPLSPFFRLDRIMQTKLPVAGGVQVEIPVLPQPQGQPQLAYRNNNPGNLRWRGQEGAVLGDKWFAKFETPEEGFRALLQQLTRRQQEGHTVDSFVTSYAPPHENNTAQYIQQLTRAFGVTEATPISQIPVLELAKFMAKKESGAKVLPPPRPF